MRDKRLREERLAGAGGTDQKNIGLAELDIAGLLVQKNALVVVVNRDGEFLLGAILPDDVAVEKLLDLRRAGKTARRCGSLLALFVLENGLADADTFVADVRARIVRRRTDQLFDLLLGLVAEGAAQRLIWIEFFHWYEGPRLRRRINGVVVNSYSRLIIPPSERET